MGDTNLLQLADAPRGVEEQESKIAIGLFFSLGFEAERELFHWLTLVAGGNRGTIGRVTLLTADRLCVRSVRTGREMELAGRRSIPLLFRPEPRIVRTYFQLSSVLRRSWRLTAAWTDAHRPIAQGGPVGI
jgi:hypothetical protein